MSILKVTTILYLFFTRWNGDFSNILFGQKFQKKATVTPLLCGRKTHIFSLATVATTTYLHTIPVSTTYVIVCYSHLHYATQALSI